MTHTSSLSEVFGLGFVRNDRSVAARFAWSIESSGATERSVQ